MISVTIKRGDAEVATFKPSDNSSQQKKVMGDNTLNLSFELNRIVNFNIGDWCTVFGEDYFLAEAPTVTKNGKYDYKYDMVMVSNQYDLARTQLMFYNEDNDLQDSDFSLTGNAGTFMDLIIKNLNRVSTGWSKGGVIGTSYKTITFSQVDCGSALAQIAKAFETEFFIKDKKINLAPLRNVTPYKFQYGSNRSLYGITRKQVDNMDVVTRLYAFGSDKNLPPDYPSERLRLPGGYTYLAHNLTWTVELGNTTGNELGSVSTINTAVITYDFPTNEAVTKVTFETRIKGNTTTTPWDSTESPVKVLISRFMLNEVRAVSKDIDGNVLSVSPFFDLDGHETGTATDPILTNDHALPYLEENTEVYGVIEGNYVNDDIFPTRTGTVTGVDGTDIYIFNDSSMDFDVNSFLLPGTAPKITFNTGQLAGYTFEISAYDNDTKQFTILKNKDEKSIDLPSALLGIEIGDQYVITDIELPLSYVQAAEQLLLAKAQEFIDNNSSPMYQYTIICDPKVFRARQIKMDIGDIVWLSDSELQVEKYIRVITLTKSLLDEFQYDIELGDTVPEGTLQKLINSQQATQGGVSAIDSVLDNNPIFDGYMVVPTAADTSGMKHLYVDANGKVWKGA